MDYTEFINTTRNYQRVDLSSNDRSLLYKIINSDTSIYRIASSKFRLRQQNIQQRNDYASIKKLIDLQYIEENQEQKRLFGGVVTYKLTAYGLLYIFSSSLIYPPQFLLNYRTNIILKTLLFPYFESKTIGQCTARFYDIITEYLRECTLLLIDEDVSPRSESESRKNARYEFDELIKILVVRLALMYSESNLLSISSALVESDSARVKLYELESSMKKLLACDRRFMHILEIAKKEFDEIP